MGCGASSPAAVPAAVAEPKKEIQKPLKKLEIVNEATVSFLEILSELSIKDGESWKSLGDMTFHELASRFISLVTTKSNNSFLTSLASNEIDWSALSIADKSGVSISGSGFDDVSKRLVSALQLGSKDKQVFFVSYPWNSKLNDIIDALKDYSSHDGNENAIYWMDCLATQMLQQRPKPASEVIHINTVIKSASGLVLIAQPWEKPVSLSRLWCLYELWVAKSKDLPVHFALKSSVRNALDAKVLDAMFKEEFLEEFDISKAQTSEVEDEETLLKLMTANSDMRSINVQIIETLSAACKHLTRIQSMAPGGLGDMNGMENTNAGQDEEPPEIIEAFKHSTVVANDANDAKSLAFALKETHCPIKELHIAYSEQDCIAHKVEVFEVFSALKVNTSIVDMQVSMPLLQREPVVALVSFLASSRILKAIAITCWLDDDRIQRICGALSNSISVSRLRLANNSMAASSAHHIGTLLNSTAGGRVLHDLQVLQNDLGDEGLHGITPALAHNTTLTSLQLYTGTLTPNGVASLSKALTGATRMREVSFDSEGMKRGWMGDAAAAAFISSLTQPASGPGMVAPALTSLDLSYTGITSTGPAINAITALLASNSRPHLTRLRLKGNTNLGDSGIGSIAGALAASKHLEELDVSDCGIGGDGVTSIGDALKIGSSVKRLTLDGNVDVVDYDMRIALMPVLHAGKLKKLSLVGTRVSPAVLEQVEAALNHQHNL